MSPQPILVTDPKTGTLINVAPLFETFNQLDDTSPELADRARDAVRRTIRLLNLIEHDSPLYTAGEVVSIYQDLHRLEDMFGQMKEQPRHQV
jgi:hypothetical protein